MKRETLSLKHVNIKTLAEADRPREKLYNKGSNAITDAELLAIIIGSGSRNETAVQLAQKILSNYNHSIDTLAKTTIYDLMRFKGIGMAKAISIMACLELTKRRKTYVKRNEMNSLRGSKAFYELVKPYLLDKAQEEFLAIFMNSKLKLIKVEILSKGNVNQTITDIRCIAREALQCNANNVTLAHNHPSGDCIPSYQDLDITEKIKNGLNMLNINLVDHIIVGNQTYYSFADEKLL
jgi:DNA repair protein RadC